MDLIKIMEIKPKEVNKIINRNEKSKFQNCFQCKFFPKKINILITDNTILDSIKFKIEKYYWDKENIEVIEFRCRYLRKRISQAIKPFRTNSCLCFNLKKELIK